MFKSVLEKICLDFLLTESCVFVEILSASFANIIAHGHRSAVMNHFHLADAQISSVQVRSCRSLILFSVILFVKYTFTPIYVSLCLSSLHAFLPIHCCKHAIVGILGSYGYTYIQAVLREGCFGIE